MIYLLKSLNTTVNVYFWLFPSDLYYFEQLPEVVVYRFPNDASLTKNAILPVATGGQWRHMISYTHTVNAQFVLIWFEHVIFDADIVHILI